MNHKHHGLQLVQVHGIYLACTRWGINHVSPGSVEHHGFAVISKRSILHVHVETFLKIKTLD